MIELAPGGAASVVGDAGVSFGVGFIDGTEEIDGLNDGRHVGSFERVGGTDGALEDVGA